MKKLINQTIIVFLLLLLLQACKKNNADVLAEKPKDVYVAGYEINSVFTGGQAIYWKNGEKINLPTTTGSNSYANSIFVTSDAVYAAGTDGAEGVVYWKNGAKIILAGPQEATNSSGIIVTGNDVYVSGTAFDNTTSLTTACYWKNGIKYNLGEAGDNSGTRGIFVNGNDLYVLGMQYGAKEFSGYWKNGVPVDLNTGQYRAVPVSIFISGNDVYLSGYIKENGNNKAAYWKNNTLISLHDPALNGDSYARSIYVENGVVYAVGRENDLTTGRGVPVYWVNRIKKYLPVPPNTFEEARSVAVSGNDVYIAGSNEKYPILWKNGERIKLPHVANSEAYSIFIK